MRAVGGALYTGYARQPLRWISTQEYDFMYKSALVAKQQLEELGFVFDLQVVDWATLNQRVQKRELWDMYVTGDPLFADPATHVSFRCTFQAGRATRRRSAWRARCGRKAMSESKALVERLQTVFYDDVGQVKLGDYNTLDVARRELRGDFRTAPRLYFWNSWLAR